MQLRRWSSRQVTNSRTQGSAGTPASVARLQQLQVPQIFAEDQEQRQPEPQGPQPGPGDPLCRSHLQAKTSFCQGVGTVCDVGGWGSRMVAVGTTCWVAPWSWVSEIWECEGALHSQSPQQWETLMLGRLDCLGVQRLGGAGVQGCHQSTGTQLGSVRNEALEEE